MGTLAVGALGISTTAIVMNKIGSEFILRSMTNTSASIISLISYISFSDNQYISHIKHDIKELDIESKLSILSTLVNEQMNNHNHPDSVNKSLMSVNNVLKKIHNELDLINKKIIRHKEKYFYSWRTINATKYVHNLTYHCCILQQRYKILIDLLNVYKPINIHVKNSANMKQCFQQLENKSSTENDNNNNKNDIMTTQQSNDLDSNELFFISDYVTYQKNKVT